MNAKMSKEKSKLSFEPKSSCIDRSIKQDRTGLHIAETSRVSMHTGLVQIRSFDQKSNCVET